MKQAPPPRYILALCLLIPLALLAASCGSNSDSTTSEDSAPDDRRDSRSDSQNIRGILSQENDSLQSFGQNRAIAITTSADHTCALLQTGTIKCWGNNRYGQLGNGTRTDSSSSVPVEVLGINDATQIATSADHTCALLQTGTIKCWGYNRFGKLGNGQSGRDDQSGQDELSSVPVEVIGINNATQITTNWGNSCALLQTGTIKCWGDNRDGQLGNGQSGRDERSSVPVEVIGINNATQITTNWGNSCALLQTGTIKCWGDNRYGQLGNGQSGRDELSSVPVEVLGINNATQITTSGASACALLQTGTIKCWGNNRFGQLVIGQSGLDDPSGRDELSSVPVEVLGITDATQITTNWGHACALLQTGTIKCWGNNSDGQLGNGTETDSSVPVEVFGINDATQITTSWNYACALLQTGTIKCWGDNSDGQLGNNPFLPRDVIGFGG